MGPVEGQAYKAEEKGCSKSELDGGHKKAMDLNHDSLSRNQGSYVGLASITQPILSPPGFTHRLVRG